jgi:hypothetical protein
MLRPTPWRATSLAFTTLLGCGREERLRVTTIDVACVDPACGAGARDASSPRDSGARGAEGPRDAADAATPRGGLDGSVPSFDAGDAAVAAAVDAAGGRDAALLDDPLVGLTVCSATAPRSVAFRTDLLDPVAEVPGSGIPGAPLAFARAWRSALVRTGLPGPALLVLSDIGPRPSGTTRALRVGTPSTRVSLDAGEAFGFARDTRDGGAAAPILAGTYAVHHATRVRGSLLGSSPIALRFFDEAGDARDLPVIGIALDAIFRSDPGGRCTALDVIDLALGFSGAALDATLDGVPLASLLSIGGGASSSLVVVHLAGPAPALAFSEGLEGAP